MSGGTNIVCPEAGVATQPDALDTAAAGFAAASKSAATRRAYAADSGDFAGWCVDEGVDTLSATGRTVGRYLTHLAGLGRSVSTIDRRAAVHRAAGHTAPTALEEVRSILTGIRNTLGRRPEKKQALTADLVAKVVKRIRGKDLASVRDRALILLCFGAALRARRSRRRRTGAPPPRPARPDRAQQDRPTPRRTTSRSCRSDSSSAFDAALPDATLDGSGLRRNCEHDEQERCLLHQ
ncbi:hypothetical protein [Methylobacterium durans]|uniref:Core-binding (CB) domain-containing protein n=1 Tax=Methylobacterium durans TaxID=2202825 RepID=A0A2U8W105_9HYPH|nr:hypothetical protein [Methylobacterium durans]AWN39725.1 hypothetical protein DK389_03200 [Methylobacterium durans]